MGIQDEKGALPCGVWWNLSPASNLEFQHTTPTVKVPGIGFTFLSYIMSECVCPWVDLSPNLLPTPYPNSPHFLGISNKTNNFVYSEAILISLIFVIQSLTYQLKSYPMPFRIHLTKFSLTFEEIASKPSRYESVTLLNKPTFMLFLRAYPLNSHA